MYGWPHYPSALDAKEILFPHLVEDHVLYRVLALFFDRPYGVRPPRYLFEFAASGKPLEHIGNSMLLQYLAKQCFMHRVQMDQAIRVDPKVQTTADLLKQKYGLIVRDDPVIQAVIDVLKQKYIRALITLHLVIGKHAGLRMLSSGPVLKGVDAFFRGEPGGPPPWHAFFCDISTTAVL